MNDCTYCGGIGCSECDVEQHYRDCTDPECQTCADYEEQGDYPDYIPERWEDKAPQPESFFNP